MGEIVARADGLRVGRHSADASRTTLTESLKNQGEKNDGALRRAVAR
jgi:hypothetical protein